MGYSQPANEPTVVLNVTWLPRLGVDPPDKRAPDPSVTVASSIDEGTLEPPPLPFAAYPADADAPSAAMTARTAIAFLMGRIPLSSRPRQTTWATRDEVSAPTRLRLNATLQSCLPDGR